MAYASPVGYTLKTPSSYFPTTEIIENSNRNANGKLIREIIAYKIKLQMSWNEMTQAEFSVLNQIRNLGNFDCEYLDANSGNYETKTFYCGNINGTPCKTDNDGHVTHWKDISANFIEL